MGLGLGLGLRQGLGSADVVEAGVRDGGGVMVRVMVRVRVTCSDMSACALASRGVSSASRPGWLLRILLSSRAKASRDSAQRTCTGGVKVLGG